MTARENVGTRTSRKEAIELQGTEKAIGKGLIKQRGWIEVEGGADQEKVSMTARENIGTRRSRKEAIESQGTEKGNGLVKQKRDRTGKELSKAKRRDSEEEQQETKKWGYGAKTLKEKA